ncbi:MAG: hypothetical protein BWY72_01018 [Bacteroidetes bacterium ADurb.Bin416]|nr:MAG: hypothetical protein BWY72_01018 [Bacteroidetes bacterium ADurb.Bin416]
MLRASISPSPSTMALASLVSCLRPQLSNQPDQNSLHINGVLGRKDSNLANCCLMLAPVPKLTVHKRSSNALSVKLELQSHWNKGTSVKPASLTMSLILAIYGLLIP